MSNKKEIPQVKLTTMLMNYEHINKNLVTYFQQLLAEHDGLVKVKLPYSLVLTDRAEIVEHVFRKNQKNYIKTKVVRENVRDQIGHGLFTSNGSYWLKQRRAIQPGFHRKKLEKIADVMVQEIDLYMTNVLDVYADQQQEIDLVEEMITLALKVLTKTLFGQDFAEDKINAFGDSVDFARYYILNETRKPYLKLWYRLNGMHAQNKKQKNIRNEIILGLIEERRKSGKQGDDLLDMLLNIRYEDGSAMTDQQLLDEVIVLFIAGHDTSAITMAWAWYLLARHPDIEQNVLQSVEETLGNRNPTFADVRSMAYPLQVIEETMRLYPAVWFLDREPLENDAIDGIPIKKGEDIAASIYSLHRNPKYWKNPNQFDPERFSRANKKKQVPFSYMPFGGGPRLCIGKNFAQMEMQFMLAMLIRRYKFTLTSTNEIAFKPLLTLCPSEGVNVKITRRS
ncbi:MAG: cytochrome P450 [Aureispira sp.]